MRQQEKSWKKSQKHFQRKVSFIKKRKAAKYVLEKNEIEELIKENIVLETNCEKIENKIQEKFLKSLKEKKQSVLWKQKEEPNDEKKHLVRMWKKLNITSRTWR